MGYDAIRDALLRNHEDTLRDQFAMAALNGVALEFGCLSGGNPVAMKQYAENAYAIADAMLEARKKGL